jgi:hypothetical protein
VSIVPAADVIASADAILAPTDITAVRRLAAELYIGDQASGLGDQRMLTQMLGLDAAPEPKTFSSADRRAVPDTFRRRGRRG